MGVHEEQEVLRTITEWNDHFAHNRIEEYFGFLSDDVRCHRLDPSDGRPCDEG